MKKANQMMCMVVVLFVVMVLPSYTLALGISPARWTMDFPEYTTDTTVRGGAVTLFQDGPFSSVDLLDPHGLDLSFRDLPTGTSLFNENTLVVDWAQVGVDTLVVPYNVSFPEDWVAPNGPGSNSMFDILWHSQIADPNQGGTIIVILRVALQLSVWQNYAPRVHVEELLNSVDVGQLASVTLRLEDKSSSWWSENPNQHWFSYEMDWDGDGLIDDIGTTSFDEAPTPHWKYPTLSAWTSGIQTGTQELNHIYDAAGSYTARLTIQDTGFVIESTTLDIPIEVTPEPTTITLLALGGAALASKRRKAKQ